MNRTERRAAERAARRVPGRRVHERFITTNLVERVIRQHQESTPEAATGLMLELHQCFDSLKNGSDDVDLFDRLASSMNTALVSCERIGQPAVDVVLAAHAAMAECRGIWQRHGRFGFTGPGLVAMVDALALYEDVVRLSTPRQILAAADEARRRVQVQRRAGA